VETYTNLNGDECVVITLDNGTTWSGLKSAWDEMQEAKENGTIS
jgi:hypothetical protein